MDQGEGIIDKNLHRKFNDLAKAEFNQDSCYKFFGNLNRQEIARLIDLITNNQIAGLAEEVKILVLNYLQKLMVKIDERQSR